ncbi:MAG: glycosyltransferase family 39 protein [bacterium]|nr:glycosyltransferase family 39 protein [bacterium]
MNKIFSLGAITAILLLGAFARLVAFGDAPAGLQHDELYDALDGVGIVERGDFALYYPDNQGREGGYMWINALSALILGRNTLMVRYASFALDMLMLALLYRVGVAMFNKRVALIAVGFASVSFWTISIARIGLRPVLLPPVALGIWLGLYALFFHTGQSEKMRWRVAIITGGLLGFAIYTYTSSFALYPAVAVFFGAMLIWQRKIFIRRWREIAVIAVLAVIIVLPMVAIRLSPEGGTRLGLVTRPLDDFRKGLPDELITNGIRLIGMPAFFGDPEWRYNIAERPLFLAPIGILVYVGMLGILFAIRKKPLNVLLLALLLFGLTPSLVTVSAPSWLRVILAMPSVMLCLAVGIETLSKMFVGKYQTAIAWGIGVGCVFITTVADWRAYFVDWANHPEVMSIYRDDLEQLGHFLADNEADLALVAVPNPDLDALTYYMGRTPPQNQNQQFVFFQSESALVMSQNPNLLFISPLARLSPAFQGWLDGGEALSPIFDQAGRIAFNSYRLNGDDLSQKLTGLQSATPFLADGYVGEWSAITYPVKFADLIELVGVEFPRLPVKSVDDGLELWLYLRPLTSYSDRRANLFVHVVDEAGNVVRQRDMLGVPPSQWNSDTIIMQDHFIWFDDLPAGEYKVMLGLYDWQTLMRYPLADYPTHDFVVLGEIVVAD